MLAVLMGAGYIIAAIVTTIWTLIVEFMLYKSDWFTRLMQSIYPIAITAPIIAVIVLIWKSKQAKAEYHRNVYLPMLKRWQTEARCFDCGRIFNTAN